MSRRKQLNPKHLESEQVLASTLLYNDDTQDSQSEEDGGDEHVCGRCRAEFVELSDFLGHKKKCSRKRIVVIVNDEFGQDAATSDQEDLSSFNRSSYYRDLEFNGDLSNNKQTDDIENNNLNFDKDFDGKIDDNGDLMIEKEMMARAGLSLANHNHMSSFPLPLSLHGLSDSNVTLEALHNTKVAVAQFSLSSLTNGNGFPPQDFGVLQSTLYTLQQQQLLQLQLIQQLQQQLETQKGGNNSSSSSGTSLLSAASLNGNGTNSALNLVSTSAITSTSTTASISSMATSSIELNQPNSLELLQRSAQQVLNNASQGLLANGLDFSKGKPSNGSCDSKSATNRNEEPFFKHRCRFCGKVFGSDSALQIHIRSHTGERPFKCNVCGNRFSTKGNLKVHFQRHKAKYPHIKMNPNPVPEHMDRFHPPLMPHEAPQHRSNAPSERPNYPGLSLSPLPPQLSRQSPIPGPLDLGHKPPSTAPTLLPSFPNESNLPNLCRSSESPASVSKAMTLSEDSRDNSVDRSMSPALSLKSEDRVKSVSPTNIDESSKDSTILGKNDVVMSPTDLAKSSHSHSHAASPSSRHHSHHSSHSHHHHHHSHSHSHSHSHHHSSHTPITSFSSLQPISSTPTFSSNHSLATLNASNALHMSTLPLTEPALDPAVYTPLLPKPGSNDNSWESLIEITKTSETSKLQQLVDNIEHKLSDPNQCVICHRVLSCKSALQMHYRTHTGERPFKCKICGRAFTTKGNLKTHMGVHRAKPPMRVLHQCPVCHKKFTNALVLQQHIRMHTGEPTELSPEQIQAAEIKEYPPTLHPALPHMMHSPTSMGNSAQISLMPSAMMKPCPVPPHLMSPGVSPGPQASDLRTSESESVIKSSSSLSEGEKSSDGESVVCKLNSEIMHSVPASTIVPTFSTSLAALENHVKGINTPIPPHLSSYSSLMNLSESVHHQDDSSSLSLNEDSAQNGDKSPDDNIHHSSGRNHHDGSPVEERGCSPAIKVESPSPGVTASSASHTISAAHSPASVISTATSETLMSGALDLTPKTSVITSIVSDSISLPTSFSGIPLPPHLLSSPGGRLNNTTCNICFKTFACNSALEIHYRSHTKERPFKCNACDRAFSTKGNMKQHMLTHKIRDLPPQLFDSNQTNANNSNAARHQHQLTPPQQQQQQQLQQQQQQQQSGGENNNNHSPGASPPNVPIAPEINLKRSHQDSNCSDTLTPIPKRPPGLPKHLCHVCHKNFSSASALQIHMRTHTGDKPFKCTICERAFTTKGNLKVHMGTHMWNNGTSRRGRRMSIELPPIPMTAKDNEFMQRRPDLYFPFMAAPFMNGLATKVNEISVIQSAAMNNGGLTSPPMGIVPVSTGIGANELSTMVKSTAQLTTPTSTAASMTMPELNLSKKSSQINEHHPLLPPTSKGPQHSPLSRHDEQPTDMSKNASWVWKLACNLCSKVCASPPELELHLQAHYKMEMNDDGHQRSPHSENLAA